MGGPIYACVNIAAIYRSSDRNNHLEAKHGRMAFSFTCRSTGLLIVIATFDSVSKNKTTVNRIYSFIQIAWFSVSSCVFASYSVFG